MAGELDLSQFHDVFFEESFENLEAMEVGLLALSVGKPDAETVNTVFRAAHSIKGGASTFGFAPISEFTHVVETLLDEVRSGDRMVTREFVDILLESVDHIRLMLEDSKAGRDLDASQTQSLIERLNNSTEESDAPASSEVVAEEPAPEAPATPQPDPTETAPLTTERVWGIQFVPLEHMLMTGNEPFRMVRELATLGILEVISDVEKLPYFQDMNAEACYLRWELRLRGDVSRESIEEVFEWVEGDCTLEISEIFDDSSEAQVTESETVQPAATESAAPDILNELEAESEDVGAGSAEEKSKPTPVQQPLKADKAVDDSTAKPASVESHPMRRVEDRHVGQEASSIRVNIDKVDNLINLVGELIITQSILNRLATEGTEEDQDDLIEGIQALERNTRELQEQTMRIRMLPIDFVLQRMPRLVRDLCQSLGKQAELRLLGNQTEVDKTVLEKISDPLTHLIRNALDHGVESPEIRERIGKPGTGVIEISAYHQGGNIIIDISDDGAGLDPDKLLAKAKDVGMITDDEELTEQEIYNLIFAPGFSTAKEVSDVSGRGVGMDVVKRNIDDLSGDIKVSSQLGAGSVFTISLPLTLSILDGQLVRVGKEIFILSMLSIVKSVQIDRQYYTAMTETSEVYRYQDDEYIPMIRLDEVYSLQPDYKDISEAILVVIDANQRYGMVVDEVLGQQQVVIKNMESNYKQVESIAGATILGDGRVAMIIDANGLVEYARSVLEGNHEPQMSAG